MEQPANPTAGEVEKENPAYNVNMAFHYLKFHVRSVERLGSFLQKVVGGNYSGKCLRRVLEANCCRVNGFVERFASTRLQKGDCVELAAYWKQTVVKEMQKIETLYEDERLRLINKPAGWVCTEENCKNTFGEGVFLLHRLDKDTTGVLALAKGRVACEDGKVLFAERAVLKEYLAIVDGIVEKDRGMIESRLVRKKRFDGQTIWGSGKDGLHAITQWETLARGKKSSLILCRPITGRMHQIRVHLSEMGHPILVDRQYASTFHCSLFVQRPLLHAFRLKLESVEALAPLPKDFQQAALHLQLERACKTQV